ncbi:MAG: phage protease [Verrucomicrobiota bacterium]
MAKKKTLHNTSGKLVAFKAPVELKTSLSDKKLPDRLLVTPWGTHETTKGIVICNATTVTELPGNQERRKFDRVALDFNHNSVDPKTEPIKVAAYADIEVVEGKGIFYANIDYTEEGRDAILGGHYIDLSPAVVMNDKGEIIFLHSTALCRQGEIDDLTVFSVSLDDLTPLSPTADESQDYRGMLVTLLSAMGAELSDDPTDEELAAEAQRLGDSPSPSSSAEPNQRKPSKMSTADAKELHSKLDTLSARLDQKDRQTLLDQAKREGKVIPLSADHIDALSLDALEDMIAKVEPTVAMNSDVAGARDPETFSASGSSEKMTPLDKKYADQLNVSEDAFEKANKSS